MSLQIKDSLSPHLAAMAKRFADRRPLLEAMGLQLTSITQRSFRDASMRGATWPPKWDGSPSNLIQTTTLMKSIRVVETTNNSVTVGTDRVYAAIHQVGGEIRPKGDGYLVFELAGKKVFAKKVTMPARPFFPFSSGGEMFQFAKERVEATAKAKITSMMQHP